MPLEPAKSPLGRKTEKILVWVISALMATTLSAMGGFWWLVEKSTIAQGTVGMLVITAFAFNRVPTQGWLWFAHKKVRWFYLPVWFLNVCAFVFGLWKTT